MSLKSEGGKQVEDPQLVALEEKINELENERKELKGKKDDFSKQCYLKLQDELIELRRKENLLRASATTIAQPGNECHSFISSFASTDTFLSSTKITNYSFFYFSCC